MIKNIMVKEDLRRKINALCETCTEQDYDDNGINKFSTWISWTASFDDNIEIDVKVCSGDYGEPLWVEAVLFENGIEIDCSSVFDRLKDDWIFNHKNQYYIVHFN